MIKVILVDDEFPALDELEYLLEAYDDIEIIATFNEPKKALEYILLNEVDACFLDISMPEMDGFMLAEAIIKLRKPPLIIFNTAFDEFAIKAFEINAVDYLLKPVVQDRLDKTLKRLRTKINENSKDVDDITNLIKSRYKQNKTRRLPLWKNDRIHLINPSDIDYIETKDGETHIYTKKDTFNTNDALNHYEDILGTDHFFRCHRSYIINLDHITEVIPWFNNTYAVSIGDHKDQIPISRRNIKTFKEMLNI